MSKITVLEDADSVVVWIHLGEATDPRNERESFIIGSGTTRAEALAMAVKDLESAIDEMQQPA